MNTTKTYMYRKYIAEGGREKEICREMDRYLGYMYTCRSGSRHIHIGGNKEIRD